MPRDRSDKGKSRAVRPELAALLVRAKAEKPRRSIRRLIKLMVRARAAKPGELSKSSVHRVLSLRESRGGLRAPKSGSAAPSSPSVREISGWAIRCTARR